MNYLFNHTSLETAYEIKDYPYGFRLRTSIFYWIETVARKGDRFCSCTIHPKNGRMNAPKKSTFTNIGVMFLDEKQHVTWKGVNIYTKREELDKFISDVGEANLNPDQKIMLRQLRGEKVVLNRDPITGDALKDFKVKWEDSEVRITFDRPDGVRIKEIFEALRSLDQDKLKKVFDGWESKAFGHVDGFARICTRGGNQLTTVKGDVYKEYLASDHINHE